MRKNFVAGNWKMNKTLQEGMALAGELKDLLKDSTPNCEVVIGTPFIHLASVSELVKDSVIKVAAENCADKASGAYTGEVSASMVKSTGAEYCILGHSERRAYYHEDYAILKEKVRGQSGPLMGRSWRVGQSSLPGRFLCDVDQTACCLCTPGSPLTTGESCLSTTSSGLAGQFSL